jgi:hypothetical protein
LWGADVCNSLKTKLPKNLFLEGADNKQIACQNQIKFLKSYVGHGLVGKKEEVIISGVFLKNYEA